MATPWAVRCDPQAGKRPRVRRPFAGEVAWIRVAWVGSPAELLWRASRAASLSLCRSLHPLYMVSGLLHYIITRL
ncbi:predicted protein [Chaetomium globosum CBS 148.51]|uniref:Uncharacterized protein n=1 Tax=Chaetomium globosum (strain ATCC 6205 / CBS 148.51 / DSM 1962 / NBRC 6347 / NRRL 1970) TaxID=306901 RepID=Q2HAW0_CHAGB|nr:uncharacterized protein CHGG_02644 [Chaetomium globosum CBS 148.51]EAQ90709.1 predicted protein [Chaetomium globosum CBS 148.51]